METEESAGNSAVPATDWLAGGFNCPAAAKPGLRCISSAGFEAILVSETELWLEAAGELLLVSPADASGSDPLSPGADADMGAARSAFPACSEATRAVSCVFV